MLSDPDAAARMAAVLAAMHRTRTETELPAPKRHWPLSWWDRVLLPPRRVRPMGLIAVQASINPFEFYLLVSICLIGCLYLVGIAPPNSVRELLPRFAVMIWAGNLLLGGLTALIGGLWRRHLANGLLAYQFGWGQIGLATFVYGFALIAVQGTGAIFPALSNLFWAFACLTRVIQVQRFLLLAHKLQLGLVRLEGWGHPPSRGEDK